MNYWLVKSEADCYSIDDFSKECAIKSGAIPWEGIRNYQARNFMRNDMKIGDLVLVYHSMGNPSGVYGIGRVASAAHIDESALNRKDEHFDQKAVAYAKEGKDPLWMCVDLAFVEKLARPVSLEEIKSRIDLRGMLVAKRGQRLSVMPVAERHFREIEKIGSIVFPQKS